VLLLDIDEALCARISVSLVNFLASSARVIIEIAAFGDS